MMHALLGAALGLLATRAQAGEVAAPSPPAVDVGLASEVQGTASLVDGQGATSPLLAFARLRSDDRLVLGEDAGVQLLFLASGRVERWQGPVVLDLSREGGIAAGGQQPQAVTVTPPPGTTAGDLPALLVQAETGRGGYTMVRGEAGTEEQLDDLAREDLARTRAAAAALRASLPDQDPLPELLLAAACLGYGLADQAEQALQDAARRCGDCPAPRRLLLLVAEEGEPGPAYQK